MQKKPLIRTVKIFTLLSLFAVLWVFIRSAGPDWSSQNPEISLDLKKVTSGDAVLMEAAGKAYYLVQPNDLILSDLERLNAHIWVNSSDRTYISASGEKYLIVSAFGSGGCILRHFNATQYNAQTDNSKTWKGGFVDLCDQVSYDYSGRLIKTAEYSYHGLASVQGNNLDGVEITSQVKNKIYLRKP